MKFSIYYVSDNGAVKPFQPAEEWREMTPQERCIAFVNYTKDLHKKKSDDLEFGVGMVEQARLKLLWEWTTCDPPPLFWQQMRPA